jgi:lipopolysaccharide/colanic/teichoic acid biosynthesis glycosyltransferase
MSEASWPAAKDGYKRPFDVAVLTVAHLLAFPVWLLFWTLIPLAIWLTDRGPVFYTQARVGKGGLPFRVIKFRTMIVDAEKSTGPIWALANDQRITPVGRVLRRLRLDELPQVMNVMKGEMSLVGPRPERPELVERFCQELPDFPQRLRVRPGIAGLAQVMGKYATVPRNKLRYDNLYIETLGPWLDLKLLVLSVWAALSRGHH